MKSALASIVITIFAVKGQPDIVRIRACQEQGRQECIAFVVKETDMHDERRLKEIVRYLESQLEVRR